MRRLLTSIICLLSLSLTLAAQGLPTDGPLTLRPMLQQLGERLLKGKTGAIVAINPANGEILCLATNTPNGSDVRMAVMCVRPLANLRLQGQPLRRPRH